MSDRDHVEIVPLGGLGEFGMNMMALRCRGTIVVVDAGLMFPRGDLLGVDFVVPDLTYLRDHAEEVRAVVLTHCHEDHIGALPFLLEEIPVPVYGTPLTLGIARGRLEEHGLLGSADLTPVQPGSRLDIGCFHIRPLGVTHSTADCLALAVDTPVGTVIHTGDFKFDHSPPDGNLSDYALLSAMGDQGVLALFSDSTNSERAGHTPSERHVARELERLFRTSPAKIVIACFASSIHRIQTILGLAAHFDRSVVALGRSMVQNIAVARELGCLTDPGGVLVDSGEAAHLPTDRLVMLTSGSQGEPTAALARLALDNYKPFKVEPGDTVILSARTIPGNETRVSHLVNHLCRRGARVFDDRTAAVHASGHASRDELELMLNLTRPRFFVPIHGEYRQLFRHAMLAQESGIPRERILIAETGDILRLTPESIEITGRAPVGRRLIDEGGATELDEGVVRDRQRLSREGVVLAVVAVNKSTGRIEGAPELASRGHVQEMELPALLNEARQVLMRTLQECSEEERTDAVLLTELVRTDLKKFFRRRTATRPMIVPVVLEI